MADAGTANPVASKTVVTKPAARPIDVWLLLFISPPVKFFETVSMDGP